MPQLLVIVVVSVGLLLVGLGRTPRPTEQHPGPRPPNRRPPTIILLAEETIPDTPHILVAVDDQGEYCSKCGSAMQDRIARFSGYDSKTGVPRYRLVRACPRARLYELFGLVWQSNLRQHTVVGPTDTRLVFGLLAVALIVTATALVVGIAT